jgi:hypothetical protein
MVKAKSLFLTKYNAMKYGGMEVELHTFIALALDGSGQLHYLQESPVSNGLDGWPQSQLGQWQAEKNPCPYQVVQENAHNIKY